MSLIKIVILTKLSIEMSLLDFSFIELSLHTPPTFIYQNRQRMPFLICVCYLFLKGKNMLSHGRSSLLLFTPVVYHTETISPLH